MNYLPYDVFRSMYPEEIHDNVAFSYTLRIGRLRCMLSSLELAYEAYNCSRLLQPLAYSMTLVNGIAFVILALPITRPILEVTSDVVEGIWAIIKQLAQLRRIPVDLTIQDLGRLGNRIVLCNLAVTRRALYTPEGWVFRGRLNWEVAPKDYFYLDDLLEHNSVELLNSIINQLQPIPLQSPALCSVSKYFTPSYLEVETTCAISPRIEYLDVLVQDCYNWPVSVSLSLWAVLVRLRTPIQIKAICEIFNILGCFSSTTEYISEVVLMEQTLAIFNSGINLRLGEYFAVDSIMDYVAAQNRLCSSLISLTQVPAIPHTIRSLGRPMRPICSISEVVQKIALEVLLSNSNAVNGWGIVWEIVRTRYLEPQTWRCFLRIVMNHDRALKYFENHVKYIL